MDILLDCLNVFGVFFLRVCVVETKVASSSEFLGRSEVHDEGLGMTYVQISVGLRRKTGIQPSAVLACRKVVYNLLFYKTETSFGRGALGQDLLVDIVVHIY